MVDNKSAPTKRVLVFFFIFILHYSSNFKFCLRASWQKCLTSSGILFLVFFHLCMLVVLCVFVRMVQNVNECAWFLMITLMALTWEAADSIVLWG